MERTFNTPEAIDLYVELGSGSLTLTADDTDHTTVSVTGAQSDDVLVEHSGNQVSVIAPRQRGGLFGKDSKIDVTVVLPNDSGVVTKTGSADITGTGRFGLAKVQTGSGDVRLDEVGGHLKVDTGSGDLNVAIARADVRLKSGSGDLEIGETAGSLGISTGSGDVKLGTTAGATAIKTGSGNILVLRAGEDLSTTTASGDVFVQSAVRGKLGIRTASGDVAVGVLAGVPVWTDINTVSGRIGSSLEGAGQPEQGQDHIELRVHTVSGDIKLQQS